MKHIHQLTLTQQQCQVLSVLSAVTRPADYLEIMLITDLSRPVIYVVAARLVQLKLARKVQVRERGTRRRVVCHVITAAGRKARERYAGELGLRT